MFHFCLSISLLHHSTKIENDAIECWIPDRLPGCSGQPLVSLGHSETCGPAGFVLRMGHCRRYGYNQPGNKGKKKSAHKGWQRSKAKPGGTSDGTSATNFCFIQRKEKKDLKLLFYKAAQTYFQTLTMDQITMCNVKGIIRDLSPSSSVHVSSMGPFSRF